MKLKLLIIFLTLLQNISYSQPKDTIYGKIKSIREQLLFLDENRQNRKLFSTEGDYGHNGFLSEEYTKSRFNIWWYQTYWVHYINYYKEFDINNKLLKVIWYYKDQTILNSCENEYDEEGKLVNQKFNSYKFSFQCCERRQICWFTTARTVVQIPSARWAQPFTIGAAQKTDILRQCQRLPYN